MNIFAVLSVVCVAVHAAPPRHYQQRSSLKPIDPLEFLSDTTEITNFYNPLHQKQGAASNQNARLETLEPDSEVELIPGAQQPQQPPQQNPVSPNIPGLAPGQRVFIVHMPLPGYRPGTIAGYQPVYIVAAAPQGNNGYSATGYPVNAYATNGYPANGYQNAVLINPASQFVNPFLAYQGLSGGPAQGAPIAQAPGPQNHGPQSAESESQQGQATQEPSDQNAGHQGLSPQGFVPQGLLPQGFGPQRFGPQGLGAQRQVPQVFGGLQSPATQRFGDISQGPAGQNAPGLIGLSLGYNRPFNQFYQNPYGFQFAPGAQGAQGLRSPQQFSQLVNLQGQPVHPGNTARNVGQESLAVPAQQKRVGEADENETKESAESQRNQKLTNGQLKKA